MMRVAFRKKAINDLNGIIEWYEVVAPESLSLIVSDIYRSIDQLIDFPRIGPKVPFQRFRRIVTRKYHFKIAYELGDNRIVILGIFRYQNREN
jgi:plasmid stabilization system protein ParE